MKKSLREQDYLAQRRKDAEVEKKIKQLFISNLRGSASLREVGYFFTPSECLCHLYHALARFFSPWTYSSFSIGLSTPNSARSVIIWPTESPAT